MDRKPVFNFRTNQMSDEMYEHVEKRINQMPDKSFRSYAFHLIERDMNAGELQNGIYDLLVNTREQMEQEFKSIHKKIDQKTFANSSDDSDIQFEEKEDIKEGELATDDITGSIDEDYDVDF